MILYSKDVQTIVGAVIGLGRATEGNKNRPDKNTHQVLVRALSLINTDTDSVSAHEITKQLHEEKFKLVPRCVTCPKQCGRNHDFHCETFETMSSETSKAKLALLSLIIEIGSHPLFKGERLDFIYDALFIVGSDKSISLHQQYIKSAIVIRSKLNN